MATLSEAKGRLTSVSSTQKVVKAMELVASSKIKKSRDKAKNVEFFFNAALENMRYIQSYNNKDLLFADSKANKNILIVITSDMGLCGGYNVNVMKEMMKNITADTKLIVVGKKGLAKAQYEGLNIDKSFIDIGAIDEYQLAQNIFEEIKNSMDTKEINGIKIVYTEFINPLTQEVRVVDFSDIKQEIGTEKAIKAITIVEPSEEEVFQKFFESYILGILYSCILQSFASEHAHRRNSMENANKNSLELIEKLNIEINRIRQANITQEITEIISGSESLNKE